MSEHRLIQDYIATVSARLPASIAEELADGLTETYRCCLRHGQVPGAAARSAIEEFGDPQVIVAEFPLPEYSSPSPPSPG